MLSPGSNCGEIIEEPETTMDQLMPDTIVETNELNTVLEDVEKPLRTVKRYVIQDYDELAYEELPEGWIRVRHASGIMVYMHQLTRVVTVSRPYNIGSENLRSHRILQSAIPCLAYRNRRTTSESKDLSLFTCSDTDALSHDQASKTPGELTTIKAEKYISYYPDASISDTKNPKLLSNNIQEEDEAEEEVDDDKEEGELSSDDDEAANSPPPSKKPREETHITNKVSQRQLSINAEKIANNLENDACQPEICNITPIDKKIEPKKLDTTDKEKCVSLAPEDVRAYCSRLFHIKEEDTVVFRNRNERFKFLKQKKRSERLLQPELSSTEQKRLICYQIPPVEGCPARRQVKEGVINPVGKSSVCILHEYCQNVFRKPPMYKIIATPDNEKSPYQVTVIINDVVYPSGSGTSKKQARAESARYALEQLLPEYKQIMESAEAEKEAGGPNQSSSASVGLREKAMEVFATVSVIDKHVFALSQSSNHTSPSPYALLTECLNRNCVPESDLKANMTSLGRSRHYFEMGIGDNLVKVPCRNKREGRHLASQELLAILHPDVKTWSGILALYGPGSKPDKRCDSEAILDAQTQRSNSATTNTKTSLIRLLKTKMMELADQWEAGENVRRKGKFNVSPFNLPVVNFHPDATKQIYSTSEDQLVEAEGQQLS